MREIWESSPNMFQRRPFVGFITVGSQADGKEEH